MWKNLTQITREISERMSIIKSKETLIKDLEKEEKKLVTDLSKDPRNEKPLKRLRGEIQQEIFDITNEIQSMECITEIIFFKPLPEEARKEAWDAFYNRKPKKVKAHWAKEIQRAHDNQIHIQVLRYLTKKNRPFIQMDTRGTLLNRNAHGLTTAKDLLLRVQKAAEELDIWETFEDVFYGLRAIDETLSADKTVIDDGYSQKTVKQKFHDTLKTISQAITGEEDYCPEDEVQVLIWMHLELQLIRPYLKNKETYEGPLIPEEKTA